MSADPKPNHLYFGDALEILDQCKLKHFLVGPDADNVGRNMSQGSFAGCTHPTFTDVLPAFAVTFRPSENVNLRMSASQTVSRPEYRELAPIQYREVIGFDNVLGNPDLQRAVLDSHDACALEHGYVRHGFRRALKRSAKPRVVQCDGIPRSPIVAWFPRTSPRRNTAASAR